MQMTFVQIILLYGIDWQADDCSLTSHGRLPDLCSLLSEGFDENLDVQGELILQDTFQVWDPKSLIRKGRDRHLFLFEISLVFSKEIKDSAGRTKYVYKSKLLVSRMSDLIILPLKL